MVSAGAVCSRCRGMRARFSTRKTTMSVLGRKPKFKPRNQLQEHCINKMVINKIKGRLKIMGRGPRRMTDGMRAAAIASKKRAK